MEEASKRPLPRVTRGIVPTAVASGLLSPVAMGAPGDLDPGFGDMGRVTAALQFHGPAWSVQPLSADESLFGGGSCDYYCSYYDDHDFGYIGQLSGTGALESHFSAAALNITEVRDVALQPDGKVIAVGRQIFGGNNQFTVLRLNPDGTIDTSFASQGVMHRPLTTGAQAVALDPGGAIAVAGSGQGNLIVLRLLTNGTLDPSFGDGGIFLGPHNDFIATDILRTTGGGYRISTNYVDTTGECRVIGLTADGKIDNSFGTSGVAAPGTSPGVSVSCTSMVAQSDGNLLLAGQQDGHGFAVRLLASGAPDTSFVAGQVPVALQAATALAVDAAGNVLVAGTPPAGVPGAVVVRLQTTGALDPLFGNAGAAGIDLDSTAAPVVHDMAVLADGRVLAAGGGRYGQPFVVRLLGEAGTPGAGVIGVTPSITVKEKDQTATVTVRRTGGAAGAVSVAYHTGDYTGGDVPTATAGQDYTAVSGQLSWADGDRTDRQITVPVADDAGPVELSERFVVTLDGTASGVALGTRDGVVEILGDGDPVGQFDFQSSEATVSEVDGAVTVVVNRSYYASGATSVTLTPVAGTATAADFATAPVTLSWADGDMAPKSATFAITPDNVTESDESFTVKLSNPTNGALIGPQSLETVTIMDSPTVSPPPSGGGGGGGLDWLTLACLSLVRWARRRVG
jgi:uncharacterized delta-60 repeat protein